MSAESTASRLLRLLMRAAAPSSSESRLRARVTSSYGFSNSVITDVPLPLTASRAANIRLSLTASMAASSSSLEVLLSVLVQELIVLDVMEPGMLVVLALLVLLALLLGNCRCSCCLEVVPHTRQTA